MQVIHHLWKGRRVRVAGVLEQIAIECPDDLAAIYRDHWELVYKRCYATLQDHEAALDATQDVFLQGLNSFDQIRHDVLRGLLDLARTISYERKRRPTREVALAEPLHANGRGDDPAEIAERHRVLDAVWAGLSPVERRYVADKFAGFSFEEIAQRNRRALGTVSSNLARAREHARRMREPLLPTALGLALWRKLTDASRRARNVVQDGSVAAAAQPVGSLTVSLTLAGLIAGAVPAMSGVAQPARAVASASGVAPGLDIAPGTMQAGEIVGQTVHATTATAQTPGGGGRSAGPALPNLLPSGSASSETPEDTRITSATPSPNYDQDHTIVALGYGHRCACPDVLMSTDGGATWVAAQGPPGGDQIVLSPTFPADPTIYVGYSNGGGGSKVSDYSAKAFGQRFTPMAGAPTGALTPAAGFDRGDDRIVISNATGAWSYDADTAAVTPLLIETASIPPSVATPFHAVDSGVIVMTTAQALSPGEVHTDVPTSNGEVLWACPPARPCTRISSVSLPSGAQIVASPSFSADRTVLAYGNGQLLASSDAGTSFTALGLPSPNLAPTFLDVAASAGGVALWATIPQGSHWALIAKPGLGSAWREVDGSNATITDMGGRVVVADAQRVLFLLAQGGLLCSVNGGVTWGARCPAA